MSITGQEKLRAVQVLRVADYWRVLVDRRLVSTWPTRKEAERAARKLSVRA